MDGIWYIFCLVSPWQRMLCYGYSLTLVMLNKLRCHAHFQFSANQITWSRMLIKIYILNGKQCRSRSVGFFRSQLIWIYTVCKDRVYPGTAGQGLNEMSTTTCFFCVFFFFLRRKRLKIFGCKKCFIWSYGHKAIDFSKVKCWIFTIICMYSILLEKKLEKICGLIILLSGILRADLKNQQERPS